MLFLFSKEETFSENMRVMICIWQDVGKGDSWSNIMQIQRDISFGGEKKAVIEGNATVKEGFSTVLERMANSSNLKHVF